MEYRFSERDLLQKLREARGFLKASSDSYDNGFEAEAVRIAATIRGLVHDTQRSNSLLGQLGLKDRFKFVDTAGEVDPRNLLPTYGPIYTKYTSGGIAEHLPLLGDGPPSDYENSPKPFQAWWTDNITKDQQGAMFARCDYILIASNKEGGTHVDPSIGEAWHRLTRKDGLNLGGLFMPDADGKLTIVRDPALAIVRQIAWELETTFDQQLDELLGAED